MGPESWYCSKWRKISKSCRGLDLGPPMPNIELVRVIFIYYNVFMFLGRLLFVLSCKNTHTHTHTNTHTHTDSNPLLWLTYLISLTMFSCNDDHFRAAPSGYPHQVIHISNTQGTSEQVSSPRGGGPDT